MAQKLSRRNRKIIGIRIKPREGLWINYQLRLRGITHQKLADQLGIRRETVTKIIRGIRHSTRIEDTLYQTLGYPSFETMIAAARKQGGGGA
jgi:transcriptional regulator with XRE-family HTH domain